MTTDETQADVREATGEDLVEIELGPAREVGWQVCEAPPRRDGTHTLRVGSPARGEDRIYVALAAWRGLLEHVGQGGELEVSGLLLGAPCAFGDDCFLDVVGFLPATEAVSSQHHVTIDHDAWQSLLAAKDARDPAERIVGWYHSHPGMGIFLSEQDRFVQKHFFAQPWQVAVVVDPIGQRWGLFGWEGETLGTRGGFHLYGPQDARASMEQMAGVAGRTIVRR